MNITNFALLGAFCAAAWGQTQGFDFKLLDKLGKNAKETSNITLDENTIKLGASMFGGDGDKDMKQFQDAVKGIRSIVIRSYEYDKEGEYNKADIEPVRSYFHGLNWSKIVDVKSEDETSEIYLNASAPGKLGGLAIVSAEPKEVTVVFISGSITPEQIAALGGKMGIPDISLSNSGKGAKPGKKNQIKDKENDDEKENEEDIL